MFVVFIPAGVYRNTSDGPRKSKNMLRGFAVVCCCCEGHIQEAEVRGLHILVSVQSLAASKAGRSTLRSGTKESK